MNTISSPKISILHMTQKQSLGYLLLTFLLVGLLAACASPEPAAPTAEPTPTAEAEPEETDEIDEAEAAEAEAEAAATPPVTEEPAEDDEPNGDEAASPSNGTATTTPLVVDAPPADCELESNLDLAGYMDIEERMGCAIDIAHFNPIAINEFGEGPDYDRFMLWFSSENNIYVLFPNGEYEVFPDEWEEGDPTFTCNPLEEEADSPPLPRRGFGKLWCENPEIQEALGFVEHEERLCQHSVEQRFEKGRLVACFEPASVRYFRILDDGTWDVTLQ